MGPFVQQVLVLIDEKFLIFARFAITLERMSTLLCFQ